MGAPGVPPQPRPLDPPTFQPPPPPSRPLATIFRDALPLPLPCPHPVRDVDPSLYPNPLPLAPGSSFPPNDRLARAAVRLFDGRIAGAESVAVAPDGTYLLADKYGWVWESKDGVSLVKIAHLGAGRPLGSHVDARGRLVVCLAGTGLVRLDRTTRTVTLLASVDGEEGAPILYANDLDIDAADGSIYFTDSVAHPPARNRAGFYDTMAAYVLSVLVGAPSGRLLRWDGKTGEVETIARGLWFANGVALSSDGAWAAVVETNSMRVLRVEVAAGEGRGRVTVLVPRLPGFPDGVTRAPAPGGGFWLALIAPAQPITTLLPFRVLRFVFGWAPAAVKPTFKAWGAVARVSDDGAVSDFLLDPTGAVVSHTSAVTVAPNGDLLLGNLAGEYVSRVPRAALSGE